MEEFVPVRERERSHRSIALSVSEKRSTHSAKSQAERRERMTETKGKETEQRAEDVSYVLYAEVNGGTRTTAGLEC